MCFPQFEEVILTQILGSHFLNGHCTKVQILLQRRGTDKEFCQIKYKYCKNLTNIMRHRQRATYILENYLSHIYEILHFVLWTNISSYILTKEMGNSKISSHLVHWGLSYRHPTVRKTGLCCSHFQFLSNL